MPHWWPADRTLRREWLVLAAILLGGAAFRIAASGHSFWFDELATLVFARQPIAHLWGEWMLRESNPPLFYTLVAGWRAVVGEGETGLRLLTIAIGTGGIVLAWALARRLGGPSVGLLCALLVALSPMHAQYSVDLRGYVLAHTAVLAAMLAAVRYLDRPGVVALVGYAAAALVALYTHTTLVFFAIVAGGAMAWMLGRDRPALLKWIATNGVIALVWSWWGWISLRQAMGPTSGFGWIKRPGIGDALKMLETAFVPGMTESGGAPAIAMLLLPLIGALGWYVCRDRRPAIMLLAVVPAGTALLLVAVSLKVPVLLPRTLWVLSGPVTVLVALAIAAIPAAFPRRSVASALLAFHVAMLVQWFPQREFEAWRAAVATIKVQAPHAAILVSSDSLALVVGHYRDRLAPDVAILVVSGVEAGFGRWGDGLFRGPHIAPAGAAALPASGRPLFSVRRGADDVAPLLLECCRPTEVPALTDGKGPLVTRWEQR